MPLDINYDWAPVLMLAETQLNELINLKDNQAPEEYFKSKSTELTDFITQLWAALYKQIQWAEHTKTGMDQTYRIEIFIAKKTKENYGKIFANVLMGPNHMLNLLKEQEDKLINLKSVKAKLLNFIKQWKTLTGLDFTQSTQFNAYNITDLQIMLLEKTFADININDTTAIKTIFTKIMALKSDWQDNITNTTEAVEITKKRMNYSIADKAEQESGLFLEKQAWRAKEIEYLNKKIVILTNAIQKLAKFEKELTNIVGIDIVKPASPSFSPSPS